MKRNETSQIAKGKAMETMSDGDLEEAINNFTAAIMCNPTLAILYANKVHGMVGAIHISGIWNGIWGSGHACSDMDLVMVDPWCVGYHGEEAAPSRSLARSRIFCKPESDCPMENGYAQLVKGIDVLVDMEKLIVIQGGVQNGPSLMPGDSHTAYDCIHDMDYLLMEENAEIITPLYMELSAVPFACRDLELVFRLQLQEMRDPEWRQRVIADEEAIKALQIVKIVEKGSIVKDGGSLDCNDLERLSTQRCKLLETKVAYGIL
ncbi:hypothetical protein SUGI_0284210 [Cryptomeria japonica]|nr:hypothetical protein SUGI_0284210 [Cryptomeria japonica]